ncbi:hypothetical protein CEXT_603621 [Caerostris extrusa]|uniref:Uncharacterized protein n=1 Tax=Caerostris extrusa TaxID=172846 RepID=A0AAV4PVS3_CAEEX|nr:hypothetical protein CEXT_603621 [Caerostris extrusa]
MNNKFEDWEMSRVKNERGRVKRDSQHYLVGFSPKSHVKWTVRSTCICGTTSPFPIEKELNSNPLQLLHLETTEPRNDIDSILNPPSGS